MAIAVKWHDKELKKMVADAAMDAVKRGCFLVEGDAKKLMKPGSGNVYPRPGGKMHHASAAGQPPAVDTGRLRASISSNWNGSGMDRGNVDSQAGSDDGVGRPDKELTGVVGTNVEYAGYLEMGTVKMGPRPYLRPALEKNRSKILGLFRDLIK